MGLTSAKPRCVSLHHLAHSCLLYTLCKLASLSFDAENYPEVSGVTRIPPWLHSFCFVWSFDANKTLLKCLSVSRKCLRQSWVSCLSVCFSKCGLEVIREAWEFACVCLDLFSRYQPTLKLRAPSMELEQLDLSQAPFFLAPGEWQFCLLKKIQIWKYNQCAVPRPLFCTMGLTQCLLHGGTCERCIATQTQCCEEA